MDQKHILELECTPDAPESLEALYREDSDSFAEHLPGAVAERPDSILLRAWTARFMPAEVYEYARRELWLMIGLALLAGLFIKLPEFFPLDEAEFYTRNIAFAPLGTLIFYLLQTQRWPRRASMVVCGLFAGIVAYLNLLPESNSDAGILVLLHAPLFLWCVAGMAFTGSVRPSVESRRAWVRFFGEVIVFSGLLFLGGVLLVGLTVGMFELLDAALDVIWEWMVPMGAVAIPVVAAWAVKRGSSGVRIMPLLARIFAPLFLVVLTAYLLRLAVDMSALLQSRDTLLMYNILLLSVLGLCVFCLSGQGRERKASEDRWLHWLLTVLVIFTVFFDGIGLFVISKRILSMGLTPNRLAVLGANLIMLGNLLLLVRGFVQLLRGQVMPVELERITARYLPIFAGWTVFVLFGMPLLFL